jgi:hypothetical protein
MRSEGHRESADAATLRARLRHVYWIGGGSGAGKSVIARRVAARHGLSLYATDDVMPDHASRCAPADCPFLSEFAAMDMDERWVNRPPEIMLETFGWFRGEGFGLIVEDLLRLPREPGVIVEGEGDRADRARNGHKTTDNPGDGYCAALERHRASCSFSSGAGDRNRTRAVSLGICIVLAAMPRLISTTM